MNLFLKRAKGLLFICLSVLFVFTSCKTKKAAVDISKKETKEAMPKSIENYYNNKFDFLTLYIKANVAYRSEKLSQKVTAEIKIKKDEQILISIRVLGITMAKALITPTQISYYEKLKRTYYEGDFSSVSTLLKTDLDFYKIQNILLGRAIDSLKQEKYTESFSDFMYKLEEISQENTKKTFYIDGNTFLINQQEVEQTKEERSIQIQYSQRKDFNQMNLPLLVNVEAAQKEDKTEIELEYSTVNFNEDISFPYSIPSDYKRINIK